MVYALTYSGIHESELDIIGKRALFLSYAFRKSLNTCLFFVVTGKSLRDFFEFNSFNGKISNLISGNLHEDYFWSELKSLFSASVLPDSVLAELKDSYDALSVSVNDANNILRSFEPRVNLFLSSCDDCGLSEVFLNIKGFDNVVNALKSCWFLFFKKQGLDALRRGDFDFSAGVVIEKFVSGDFTVEVEGSSIDKDLLVSAYKGLPEVSAGIVKDLYVLSFNHLEFVNYELNHQNFSIIHQDGSGVLLKKRLGKEGSDNKASKQVISECARLAKRVFTLVDKFVKVIFIVKQGVPYLFLIDDCSVKNEGFVNDVSKSIESESINPSVVSSVPDSSLFPGSNISSEFDADNKSDEFANNAVLEETSDLNDDFEESVDSDEFIVQEGQSVSDSVNDFSSFYNLVELLEEDIVNSYKESFGFSPSSVEDAVNELDSKHGFSEKEKILRVLEVKSMLLNGEEVDEDIISSLIGIIEDFLREAGK